MKVVELALALLYVVVCVGIGFWASRKVKQSTQDYWVAGRSIGTFANSWAMMATLASGGSVLGVMGLAYTMGIPYVFSMFAGAAAGFPLAAILVARQLRNLEVYTVTDFLRFRYNNKILNVLVPILIVVTMCAYLVAQLKAAGVTAVYLLDIPYEPAVVITALIFTLYVSIGGMWAITLTDIVQGILMVGMVLLLSGTLFIKFGGFTELISRGVERAPHIGSLSDSMGDASYMGAFVVWLVAACVAPHLVMRIFTARDGNSAKRSLNFAVLIYATMIVLGVLAMAPAGHIDFPELQDPDTLFLKLIDLHLPTVLGGLAVAAVLAAVMSTTDALLLAASSAISHDIYARYFKPQASQKTLVRVGLLATWSIGALSLIFALNPPELLTMLYSAAIGLLGSTLFWPVVLGIWWKKSSPQGALWSVLLGGGSYLYLLWFSEMPALTQILVSLPIALLAHVGGSLLSSAKQDEVLQKIAELHGDLS